MFWVSFPRALTPTEISNELVGDTKVIVGIVCLVWAVTVAEAGTVWWDHECSVDCAQHMKVLRVTSQLLTPRQIGSKLVGDTTVE